MEQPLSEAEPQTTPQQQLSQPFLVEYPPSPDSFSKPPRQLPKIMPLFVLFVFFVGGAILGYFSLQQSQTGELSSPAVPTPIPQVPPRHYVGSQTISLRDVQGGNSTGTVTRTYTQNQSTHFVEVRLFDFSSAGVYQVWITKDLQILWPLGSLHQGQNGKYTFTATYNFSPSDSFSFEDLYNTVVISLETNPDDDFMETKILEGKFTQ